MEIKTRPSKLKLINFIKAIDLENINEIYISNGVITSKEQAAKDDFTAVDCKDCIIAPGFIDPQLNGLEDCDFWQLPDFKKIDDLRLKLALSGVTAFCPTIITGEKEKIIQSITHINSYVKQCKDYIGAKILGIHLEGVFITKYGVHKSNYAQKELTLKNLEPFIKENVVIFTLAPELDKTGEAIEFLQKNNILVSIGHSNATYKEGSSRIKKFGLSCVTHMFNSLRGIEGFSHRGNSPANLEILKSKLNDENMINSDKDGIILSILKDKNICCMVIADGLHVNKEVLEFLYRVKGKKNFSLATDMVSTEFFNLAKNHGTLGGGQTTMEKCVLNLVQWGICNIEDALICASKPITNKLRIAKDIRLRLPGLGQLSFGKEANITLWDTKKNRVKGTIIGENMFLNY